MLVLQVQGKNLTPQSVYDSITVKDSFLIQLNMVNAKTLNRIEQKINSYEKKIAFFEDQFDRYNMINLISHALIIIMLVVISIAWYRRRKLKTKKKNLFKVQSSEDSIGTLERLYEGLKQIEDKINHQTKILIALQNENKTKKQKDLLDEEVTSSQGTSESISSIEPPSTVPLMVDGVSPRYLRFDSESFYKEIYVSDRETNFYESNLDEKDKTSKVNITEGIVIKSSAAKSRFTPLFDVEGDYGRAIQKRPAIIIWQGDVAHLHERGKIKLIE